MIPAFPPHLVKRATSSEFEVEPFEVELATFEEFFPVVKRSFILKKEKNSLSDLSHNARGFLGSRFFRVQLFQGPGVSGFRFFWVQHYLDPGFSGSRTGF